jgi:spermidine synthase
LEHVPLAVPLRFYLARYEPLNVEAALVTVGHYLSGGAPALEIDALRVRVLAMLYVAVPLVITGPPTAMMGLSFPFLQRVVQRDLAVLGRRVGWLQTANIFGSMLGAGLTGWGLLRFLGTAATMKVLVLCGAFFIVLFLVSARRERGAAVRLPLVGAALAGVVAIAWSIPDSAALWARLHGTTPDRTISAEDGSGLSLLKSGAGGFTAGAEVYANGLGQSSIPFPGHHVTLGLMPVMLHPNPRDIAIVGLGSGATLFAAAGRSDTERITAIEIVAPQLATLRQLGERTGYRGLAALLDDRRITFTFADARAVIRLGDRKYDLIEADALRPTSAYAGNLYSVEHFVLLREHLKPGGYAVNWAPTQRVIDTFVSVFPHAMLYEQLGIRMLIGSNEPITWNGADAARRLESDFSRTHYGRAGIDTRPYVAAFARATPTVFAPDYDRSRLVDLNTDLFPRDEFLVPARR